MGQYDLQGDCLRVHQGRLVVNRNTFFLDGQPSDWGMWDGTPTGVCGVTVTPLPGSTATTVQLEGNTFSAGSW